MAILLGLVVPACQAFQAAHLQGFPCSRALHHSSLLFPLPWLYMCILLLQKSLSAKVNRWKLCSTTFCPALGCRVVACPFFSLVAYPIFFVTYLIFLLPIPFFSFISLLLCCWSHFYVPYSISFPISFVLFFLIPFIFYSLSHFFFLFPSLLWFLPSLPAPFPDYTVCLATGIGQVLFRGAKFFFFLVGQGFAAW